MPHRFHTLDVFTTTALTGNQLAVVLEADDLGDQAMQVIAAEFNIAETVFVMKPENPAHTARVRIFTPVRELPFAGHPTVGTAILLAQMQLGEPRRRERDAMIVLEQPIGIVRAGVRLPVGKAPFAVFDLPRLPEPVEWKASGEAVARALGLMESDLCFDNHKLTRFDAGVPFSFVPVRDLEAIVRARPASMFWEEAFGDPLHSSAYVYCRETLDPKAALHARMFWPGAGIAEDPATGSAVAALAGVIAQFESLGDGGHELWIEQGHEMGRPSCIHLEIDLGAGRLRGARIGGHAVLVQDGTLHI